MSISEVYKLECLEGCSISTSVDLLLLRGSVVVGAAAVLGVECDGRAGYDGRGVGGGGGIEEVCVEG